MYTTVGRPGVSHTSPSRTFPSSSSLLKKKRREKTNGRERKVVKVHTPRKNRLLQEAKRKNVHLSCRESAEEELGKATKEEKKKKDRNVGLPSTSHRWRAVEST